MFAWTSRHLAGGQPIVPQSLVWMVIGGWIAQQAVELALRRHPSFRYQVQVGWTVMILSQLGGRVRYVKSVRDWQLTRDKPPWVEIPWSGETQRSQTIWKVNSTVMSSR